MMRFIALFVLATLPASANPSFDCARADSGAERMVCAEPALADLDRELATTFRAALSGPDMTGRRAQVLRATQRGWIKGRDDCWKAEDEAICIRDGYALRIAELRADYEGARQDGITIGPLVYSCEGLAPRVAATFVNTGVPLVVLSWGEDDAVLPLTRAASGSRYADDDLTFWIKGDTATFEFENGVGVGCTLPG